VGGQARFKEMRRQAQKYLLRMWAKSHVGLNKK
jgi:hypothetical protein